MNHRTGIIACATLSVVLIAMSSATALRKDPTWAIQTDVQPDAKAGGWFLNLGITGARGKIAVSRPTIIEVTYVFDNTPAYGQLEVGDHIQGANGASFKVPHKFGYGMEVFGYEGPMMDLGNALEHSQSPAGGGVLTLDVERQSRSRVVRVPVGSKYGAFSSHYPQRCAKTAQILDEAFAYLAARQGDDGHWHRGRPHIDAFAMLALLASGEDRYAPNVERAARSFARDTSDKIEYEGLDCWKYTLFGTALAEYYLATRAEWVIPELKQIDRWLRKAQIADGGWGHRPANRPGGNGYGSFCAMTGQAVLAWALMRECGLAIDESRFASAQKFLADGTNQVGYVWYAAESAHPTDHADMGRTGTSAVAHLVAARKDPAAMAIARRHARCIGRNPTTFPDTHGSPLLGMAFTALGAGADPAAARQLFDYNRWHFALSHCPDGTFYYQPNRDNNPQDYTAAPRLSATAATALVLSMGRGRLAMMQRPSKSSAQSSTLTPASGEPVHIWIMAGQSNMEGPGNSKELQEIAPHLIAPRDDAWCVYARHWPGPLAPRFGFRPNNFGPELAFGHGLADQASAPLILFKSSIGGRTLHRDYRPPLAVERAGGTVGPLYLDIIRRFHNLVEHIDTVIPEFAGRPIHVAGLVWLQGESDTLGVDDGPRPEAERGWWNHYEANLRDLIHDVRRDTGIPDLPVVIAQINDSDPWESKGGGIVVRAAQRQVAEDTPGCTWFRTDDLHPGYHYDSKSIVVIGERAAEAAGRVKRTIGDDRDRLRTARRRFQQRRVRPAVDSKRSATLADGLKAYWRFDEGRGDTARSEVSRHVARFNASDQQPVWTSGIIGHALEFKAGAHVAVPGFSVVSGEAIDSFSVSCWVRKASKRSGMFVSRAGERSGWAFGEAFNEGWPVTRLWAGGAQFEEVGGWASALSTGDGIEWHHIVTVFDAPRLRLDQYVDGVLVAHKYDKDETTGKPRRVAPPTVPVHAAGPEVHLMIGAYDHGPQRTQSVDEVAVWSRALSESEIETLFSDGFGLPIPTRHAD
jgi:hypothetical protein